MKPKASDQDQTDVRYERIIPDGEFAMRVCDRAIAQRKENDDLWIIAQFEQVRASLLNRPPNRRGPFSIGDDELKAATTGRAEPNSRQTVSTQKKP